MTYKIFKKIGKAYGIGFGKSIVYIGLGILLLYGCGGGGGGGSETNSSGTKVVSIPIEECVNPNLNISYDPDLSVPDTRDTIVNLSCSAEKIALVVISSSGAPTSKNYYLTQNTSGDFYIPKTVWDEVLQGASKGSYDIDLLIYESGEMRSIKKAGKVNLLNDYPPKD